MYRAALATLHTRVVPHVPNPTLLADFLTDAYGKGGLVAVLALNALFLLMTRHGLEGGEQAQRRKWRHQVNPWIKLASR